MKLAINFAEEFTAVSSSERNLEDIAQVLEQEVNEKTPIQQFYSNETIFITGGTGFLGKILIEKLLRCCPDVKRIYILIRQKKNKNTDERIKDLLNDSVFQSIRDKKSQFRLREKVIAISGDCSLPNLGMSESDRDLLLGEVTIVFNVAAVVRFDEPLKLAVNTNIQSASSMLDLCKNIGKLKSFVHVSTAYSNCFSRTIEEKFYDYPLKYYELLNLTNNLSEDTLNSITPKIINSWPNTYTFTKAMAEDLIRHENQNLPMGIFRPGIVASTAYEPFPGWTDNYNGPMGVATGCTSGVMRVVRCDGKRVPNVIPVDLTVNALLSCAWDVAAQKKRRGEDMLIYNYTSTVEAPITWERFRANMVKYANKYPPQTVLWYAELTLSKQKYLYALSTLMLHSIPGFILDTIARLAGKEPRMHKTHKRVHKLMHLLTPFCLQEWEFKNDNTLRLWDRLDARDKEVFQFSMKNFDWPQYMDDFLKGIRTYMFKDSIDTLEASRAKVKRFYRVQQLCVLSLIFMSWVFTWIIYSTFFQNL